jgi:hypothetical protein
MGVLALNWPGTEIAAASPLPEGEVNERLKRQTLTRSDHPHP